jgi:hypothetical protein
MKRLIGYYIRSTYKVPPSRGKTLCADTHDLYPTREAAEAALPEPRERDRYAYDVAEVWMNTTAEAT